MIVLRVVGVLAFFLISFWALGIFRIETYYEFGPEFDELEARLGLAEIIGRPVRLGAVADETTDIRQTFLQGIISSDEGHVLDHENNSQNLMDLDAIVFFMRQWPDVSEFPGQEIFADAFAQVAELDDAIPIDTYRVDLWWVENSQTFTRYIDLFFVNTDAIGENAVRCSQQLVLLTLERGFDALAIRRSRSICD